MVIRQAREDEFLQLFVEGYKFWSKNRTLEQYISDNRKEDAYGNRYVAEVDGQIVSSLILLNLKYNQNIKAYGIGSVVTPKQYAGKGYATGLIKYCLSRIEENSIIFLYSDVKPEFYEKMGFRVLPAPFQKSKYGICMVWCQDTIYEQLVSGQLSMITEYF